MVSTPTVLTTTTTTTKVITINTTQDTATPGGTALRDTVPRLSTSSRTIKPQIIFLQFTVAHALTFSEEQPVQCLLGYH